MKRDRREAQGWRKGRLQTRCIFSPFKGSRSSLCPLEGSETKLLSKQPIWAAWLHTTLILVIFLQMALCLAAKYGSEAKLWPNRDQDGGSEGGTSNGVIKLNAEGDWCGFKLCLKLDHIYGVLSGERGIGQCRHLNQWVWITMTTGLEWQSNVITENI